jgi:four helix bundle protein
MSYKKLDIWKLARGLTIEIHKMTLTDLPKFEMYETGSQIRRSMKSVRSNIVEGYGRRTYKLDYIKHIIYAQASNDETIDHLETLFECESLTDEKKYISLLEQLNQLGKMINKFFQSLEQSLPVTRNQKPAASK